MNRTIVNGSPVVNPDARQPVPGSGYGAGGQAREGPVLLSAPAHVTGDEIHHQPIYPPNRQDSGMSIDFARSERSRLGIEWEIACVDRRSGELSPAAPELLSRLGPATSFPHVTTELLTNTVEIVSAPHHRARDAVADLTGLVEDVHELAEPLGQPFHFDHASARVRGVRNPGRQ